MHSNKFRVGATLLASLLVLKATCTNSSISRDVVIIGGGASGSHAAVWLRDQGKSVVVVEKQNILVSSYVII